MITIKVTRNFDLNNDVVRESVRDIYNVVGDTYLDYLKSYPRQRNPDSDYIRGYGMAGAKRQTSEDLGARWTKVVEASRLIMEIGNNASYAPYVQSEELQADIHRHWWQTDVDAINMYSDLLTNYMSRFVTNYVVR